MSKSRDGFQARERLSVEDRRRGIYIGPILKRLEQLDEVERFALLLRVVLKMPASFRRRLFVVLLDQFRGHGSVGA